MNCCGSRSDGGGAAESPFAAGLLLYAAGVVVTTVVAGLATTPFALYHFNRVAAYSVAANVLAVPVAAMWIMPWAMLAYALMPLGLEGLALAPMGWGISFVLAVARTVAAWPGAAYTLPMLPMAGLALVSLGGLWMCLWRRRWRLAGLPLIFLGLASTGTVPPPDVLVSDDGTYFAVRRADGGLWATSIRSNYTVDSWLRRDGLDLAGRWPKPGAATADGVLRCDSGGCVYRAGVVTVALAETEDALAEDCREADAVVAVVAVFIPCAAGVVVDRLDLWRQGAHAIWITPAGVRVDSVSERRGNRPWVLPRHRRSE